jgi:pimeloyl-ACP methyl ester carboxylesterase
MRRIWKFIAIAGLAALLLGVAISWAAGSAMVAGRASAVSPAAAPALDFYLVERDGVILAATYRPGRRPGAPSIRNRIASRLGSLPARLLEPLLSFQAKPRFGVWPSELAPAGVLPRFRGPVLVIGGEHDRSTPPAESRAMFAAAGGPRSLWLISDGDHPDICDARDDSYRAHVRAFLERTIGAAASPRP